MKTYLSILNSSKSKKLILTCYIKVILTYQKD